jgi:hypothetical protein
MLNKNSMLAGVLAGLVIPALGWGAAYLLRDNFYIINKPAIPYFVAIALNLILLRICMRRDLDKTGRGIMFTTFMFMLLIFIFKTHLR